MKSQFKKVLTLCMALVMILSLAPVSNAATSGDADYIKVNIAGPADPGNYLPFGADNSVRDTYSCYFYEQLFDMYSSEEGLFPTLASGYEREEDGDTGIYTVHIREGIYDHAGNPLTANDVAFSYNSALEKNERTSTFGEMKPVEVIDDYTVKITIQPDALGTFERIVTSSPVVTQKAYEASATGFSSDPVGTGPYYIKEWVPGSYINFVKDENYWAKDLGFDNQNCDEIYVKFIAEPAQATIEMETGGVDFAYNISTKDAVNFEGVPGYGIVNSPFTQVRCVTFNFDPSNPFSDLRLRQAVAYAIDAPSIVQVVYDGKGGAPTVCAVPEPEAGFVFDYDPAWKDRDIPYAYNIEKAQQLMAEAGYPNGGLHARLMTKDNEEYQMAAQIMQALLAQIGIDVEILAYENALYQTYRWQDDKWDIQICGWAHNGIPYLPMGFKWYLNRNADTGRNVLMMNDDKMQEILDASLSFETHSNETVNALMDYVVLEQVALYPYAYTLNNYVYVDTILDPVVSQGIVFYPNMSHYADNWARHS